MLMRRASGSSVLIWVEWPYLRSESVKGSGARIESRSQIPLREFGFNVNAGQTKSRSGNTAVTRR